MGRILFWLLLGLAAYLLVLALRRGGNIRDKEADTPHALAVVACAHCGLHVPESEALVDGDRRYCSLEHQRLGPRP